MRQWVVVGVYQFCGFSLFVLVSGLNVLSAQQCSVSSGIQTLPVARQRDRCIRQSDRGLGCNVWFAMSAGETNFFVL